jgi:prepilin-type N-terminal cleavage/methylation domain-containing protein
MKDRKMIFTPTPIYNVAARFKNVQSGSGRLSKMLNYSVNRCEGFTLVELLVVLSVIAMLMGILMPVLYGARRIAYKTACKENLHGCAIAFRIYLDENKNTMPTITNMPNAHLTENPIPITSVLGKYLSGPEALKCPADPQAKYFREQGSSYEYNTSPPPFPEGPFNHQSRKIDGKGITMTRRGEEVTILWAEIYVLRDYEDFHGKAGKAGSRMYLYADTLVADRERNK